MFPGAGRENSFSFVIGNYAYVTCGTNGINYNDCWRFDPNFVTAIEDKPQPSLACTVFPSPVHDEATITLENFTTSDKLTFTLFDSEGKLIRELDLASKQTTLHRNGLPCGIYFYEVRSSAKQFSCGKLIIE